MIYEETNDWRKEFGRALDILNWDVFKMDFKPTDISHMLSDKRNERLSIPHGATMTRDDITDRELLELAAKAAGIGPDEDGEFCIQPHQDDCRWWDDGFCTCGAIWNPLDDDGDALRLAAMLRIDSNFHAASVYCSKGSSVSSPNVVVGEFYDTDPLTAARRAIVRAAAEIGRNMK